MYELNLSNSENEKFSPLSLPAVESNGVHPFPGIGLPQGTHSETNEPPAHFESCTIVENAECRLRRHFVIPAFYFWIIVRMVKVTEHLPNFCCLRVHRRSALERKVLTTATGSTPWPCKYKQGSDAMPFYSVDIVFHVLLLYELEVQFFTYILACAWFPGAADHLCELVSTEGSRTLFKSAS